MALNYLDPNYIDICDSCRELASECEEDPSYCEAEAKAAWIDMKIDEMKEDGPLGVQNA